MGVGNGATDFPQAGQKTVLLVAPTGDAADGREAVTLARARLVGDCGWDEVAARLETRLRIDTMLVEAQAAAADELDAVLPRIDRFARESRAAIVVALRPAQIDQVAAHLLGARAHLLCEPTLADRVAALVLADGGAHDAWFDDARGSAEAERLRRLSEEVARIAERLAELTRAGAKPPIRAETVSDATRSFGAQPRETARVDPAEVRKAIRTRRLREQLFPAGLFEDPAWDMLLDLFAAELETNRVSVSSLCIAASVAPTTALRWIGKMVDIGLFERHPDPLDRRRAFMELSPAARGGMAEYFAAVARARLSVA